MHEDIKLTEKYERQGWPSLPRPDLKPPEGWSLSLITSLNCVRHHCLSPDGQQLAFIWDREDLSDVYTMPSNGGWPGRVSTERGPTPPWDDEVPQWSPDGRWLAFTMRNHVYVALAAGGLPRKISDFTSAASSPVWLAGSESLIISVERHEADKLLLTDRDGSWPRALTTGPGDDVDAQPSPDGRLLAFVHAPHDDLNRLDLNLLDLASGQVSLLTGMPQQKNWWPRWSPDGRLLAFLSQQTGWSEVWLIRPDGDGLRQLTRLGQDVADLAWSPDGSWLACTVNRGGAIDLALIEVQSGQVSYLRTGLGHYARPNCSPQGDFLTVEYEDATHPPDLYRVAVTGGQMTQLTFSNSPALAQQPLVVPERVSYRSFDGLEISAFLYRPAQPNGAAILYPHGGPTAQYMFEWDVLAQYFVAKGYTYLCPNYRGGTGYGAEFERANYFAWGIGDTQDCLYGARYLRELEGVDPQRLAIYGSSYGGYLAACCLSRDPDYLFACGVSRSGDAHLLTTWAQCNRHLRLYAEMPLSHPAQQRQVYRDGSPIFQVENVQKPVLILHGLEDDVVPPEAAEEWVEALRRAGKTFEYKTYSGVAHGFFKREHLLDVYRRVERFLDWYLLPA
ncbi:MAG: S9 family peptidase [Anaerolineae bacterium]|nr:S9 family peptidase [Anaerolineae bacterium]